MDAAVNDIRNVAILNKEFQKETWYNTFWAKFAGFTDIVQGANGNIKKIPSGKPIEIMRHFVEEGRDHMLVPFLNQLAGDPVYGDTVLKGTGEDQVMKYLRVYVNQWRAAVTAKSGSMANQRVKIYDLIAKAKPQLQQLFTKWENQYVFQALLEGASGNITAGTDDDGIGLKKRYHPNWYVNDGSTLTDVGTDGSTKTAGQLDTAVTNCDSKMDADILQELRIKCMELKIPQMVSASGKPYWAMLVHPRQLASLQTDSIYYGAQREAFSGWGDSPELQGMAGYYNGFAIFEDIVGVRSWDSTNNNFSNTNGWLALPTNSNNNYNAIVFGNGAVGKGVAEGLHFTKEVDDHGNIEEIGGAVINGYNRADFCTSANDSACFSTNNAAAGVISATAMTNQSSLVLMTDPTGS